MFFPVDSQVNFQFRSKLAIFKSSGRPVKGNNRMGGICQNSTRPLKIVVKNSSDQDDYFKICQVKGYFLPMYV